MDFLVAVVELVWCGRHQSRWYAPLLHVFSAFDLFVESFWQTTGLHTLGPGLFSKKTICKLYYTHIYSPTKVKHHLTCFNNIFSIDELISNRFAVFVTCTHILTYLPVKQVIHRFLFMYI
jgi:hypothetical protein